MGRRIGRFGLILFLLLQFGLYGSKVEIPQMVETILVVLTSISAVLYVIFGGSDGNDDEDSE